MADENNDALKSVVFGSEVKMREDGIAEGLLVMFGSEDDADFDGEYFTKDTDFDVDWDEGGKATVYFNHGMDPVIGKSKLGGGRKATLKMTEKGIWIQEKLLEGNQYDEMVMELMKRRRTGWSSGTAGHMVERERTGKATWIKRWPLGVDASITHVPNDWRNVATLKSVHSLDELKHALDMEPRDTPLAPDVTPPVEPPREPAQAKEAATGVEPSGDAVKSNPQDNTGEPDVNISELVQTVTAAAAEQLNETLTDAERDAVVDTSIKNANLAADAAVTAEVVETVKSVAFVTNVVAEIRKAKVTADGVADAVKGVIRTQPAQSQVGGYTPTPQVSVSEPRKYWHMNSDDLLFAYMTLKGNRVRPSEELTTIMTHRVAKSVDKDEPGYNDMAVKSLLSSRKANEIAISTAASGGDEWVGVAYSTRLWESARHNRIYEDLVRRGMWVQEIPQGMESVYIPTQGADPTVYTRAQNADLDATSRPTVTVAPTRIGTGRVQLTPGELAMSVVYNDIFEEDSLIAVAPQYQRQMMEKAGETVEQLFLNGDVQTSTTNVNYDGGTPGTGLSTPYYIASNGARKYALVTGSSTSRSGGTLDEDDFRLTLSLFPAEIQSRFGSIAFVIDPYTHNTALSIPALKTDDVRRTNATITSGRMTNIYGVDTLVSGFLPLTDTDGKVTYNAAGTKGSILAIYAPYWAVGWKRQITMEADRDIQAGANIIVASWRVGFVPRGAGAAVETYNLDVA